MAGRYEHEVAELREGMGGGAKSGSRPEKVRGGHACECWQLKAVPAVDVRGRSGPGGGALPTVERPVS